MCDSALNSIIKSTDTLPLISIIVPVYNVEEYLNRCLQSICRQTYHNLEIILIDDGSTDNSGRLCDKFAQKDKRIRVIHQANSGLSAARNTGLKEARGEYLGFVDSDDWIEADMYEFLFCLMKRNEADISICTHYRDEGKKITAKYASGKTSFFTRENAIRAIMMDKHIKNYVWDKLFKRAMFDGIRFPANRVFEDVATTYRALYKAKKIVLQESPKYHYTIREGSITKDRNNSTKDYQLFLSIYEQAKFVQEKGIWDKAWVYMIRNGIRLLSRRMMKSSPISDDKVACEVIDRMHEFDEIDYRQLGVVLSLKRYLIYNHINLYQKGYRMMRTLIKSKRYLQNG